MISSKTIRQGMFHPLADYQRQAVTHLPVLWQKAGITPTSQSQALRKIEDFVDYVDVTTHPAFTYSSLTSGRSRVRETVVGRRLLDVLPLLGLFDSDHDYAEKPYAFLEACWLMECVHRMNLLHIGLNPASASLHYAEQLNEVVEKIRMSTRQEWFRRGAYERRIQSNDRAERINDYLATLLYRYAKLVLIRLDFGYPQAMRQFLTIDRVIVDLRAFLYLKGFHRYFKHLKGYIWAIEDGSEKGPHIHLHLIYDGSQVREDITLGELIRRTLWDARITRGEGISWNSNLWKERFSDVGVGVIRRDDLQACRNAIYYATYLAKDPYGPEVTDPQYLRIKPTGADAFGMGELSVEPARSGRPPRNPVTWVPSDMVGIRWPDQQSVCSVKH